MVEYVKLRRGTRDIFNRLQTKDADTLYIVYENADSTNGMIYLGDKCIGDGTFENFHNLLIDDPKEGDALIYTNIAPSGEDPNFVWKAMNIREVQVIPDDYVAPQGGELEPGDTLYEALRRLDERGTVVVKSFKGGKAGVVPGPTMQQYNEGGHVLMSDGGWYKLEDLIRQYKG